MILPDLSPETPAPTSEDAARLLRALADETRLRVLGILAESPRTQPELVERLKLTPAALSRHLALLQEAGLISGTHASGPLVLDLTPLRAAVRQLTASASPAEEEPALAADARLFRRFFDHGKLRSIPARQKDKEIVLSWILRRLPDREEFAEADLNGLLKEVHADFCTLRRDMVGFGYLRRNAGVYRWTDKGRVSRTAEAELQ